jgi:hypothetical protein
MSLPSPSVFVVLETRIAEYGLHEVRIEKPALFSTTLHEPGEFLDLQIRILEVNTGFHKLLF